MKGFTAAGGIFLYKTPNQAYQLLEDKVLLKLDWAKNQKTKSSLKKTIAFADEGSSNSDTDKIMARMDAITMKMDARYKEFQSRSKQPNLDHKDDDKPMSLEEEAKFMQTFRRSLNIFEWRKIIFRMITGMGIHHAKAYTLHGRSSTKLGQRLSKTWQFNNHQKNSSKPDRAHICTINGSIQMTPPPGLSTPPQIPNNTTSESLHVITTVFAATTPENTPFVYRASTSANPNPMISPAFMEENYEVLESLQRERRRRGRNAEGIRPSEIETREDENRGAMYAPLNMPVYPNPTGSFANSTGDPDNFLHLFEGAIRMQKWLMPVACHMFTYTLKDSARIWWNSQKTCSILNYEDLKAKFRSHFSQEKKFTKTHLAVHNIKQREGESTRAFVTRYTNNTLQILGLHEEQRISGFIHGLRTRSLVEHLSTDLPSTYKGLMEKTYT
ncbi:reverse transcriptase domain-containing protein [Tanacetum coccineum]